MKQLLLVGLCGLLLLPGCGKRETKETPAPTLPAVETPALTQEPTETPVAEPTETPAAEPTSEPTPEQTPEPAAGDGAGMTAGADYDFSAAVPQTAAVEDSYFDDAAFIGDSRIDGFRLYSGITNGEFIVHTGLSIFQVDSREITYKGQKMKVLDALGKGSYKKVYVSMGINELGMYNDQGYHDRFAKLVDDIRAQQPDATIYIQLLIPVNEKKCQEKGIASYIENEHLQVYNDLLRQVAQEKHVFLVDPAEELTDETGEPPYDSVADGVHFNRAPYQQWFDYLKRHTIQKGEWNA